MHLNWRNLDCELENLFLAQCYWCEETKVSWNNKALVG